MIDEQWGDLDDNEYPDPDDDPWDDDESVTVPCPKCGCDVYEDAEQCPLCGEYITHDTSAWTGRAAWWIALGLLGILAAVVALAVY